jgi:2-keto-4-pentenoate hydratase/2-oxohepta-3-ene-1,7-dioic acid hydratase in catechol pathway
MMFPPFRVRVIKEHAMRLVTFERRKKEALGAIVGDLVFDLAEFGETSAMLKAQARAGKVRAACAMSRLLALGRDAVRDLSQELADFATRFLEPHPPFCRRLRDVRLLAPVPWPNKLFLLAGNYAEHVREFGGGPAPERETTTPYVFLKPPTTTVIGPDEAVRIPRNGVFIDYELEIAAVMGGYARFVSPEEAEPLIAGYTILNDISERRLKIETARALRPKDAFFDWLNGKWFDTFAPMGPCLATTDELGDVSSRRMELRVNGDVRQRANPGQMVFRPAELVRWISRLCTLEPGDVISTGTPAGVGLASGRPLADGDVIEAEIEGIGVLRSPVRAEP